jgi:hypothetical protein
MSPHAPHLNARRGSGVKVHPWPHTPSVGPNNLCGGAVKQQTIYDARMAVAKKKRGEGNARTLTDMRFSTFSISDTFARLSTSGRMLYNCMARMCVHIAHLQSVRLNFGIQASNNRAGDRPISSYVDRSVKAAFSVYSEP